MCLLIVWWLYGSRDFCSRFCRSGNDFVFREARGYGGDFHFLNYVGYFLGGVAVSLTISAEGGALLNIVRWRCRAEPAAVSSIYAGILGKRDGRI